MASRSGFTSIGTKLAVSTTTILLVAASLLFLQLSSAERDRLVSAKAVAAAMMSDMLSTALAAPLDFGDQDALDAEVARLRSNRTVSYAAVWSGERVSPSAELLTGTSTPAQQRPDPKAVAITADDRVIVIRPVLRHDGKVLGVAQIDVSLESENQAFIERRRTLLLVSLAVAVAMAMILALIARRVLVVPLGELVDASQRLQRGERAARVVIESHDEIGRLGDAFNDMAVAIDDREARLAAANRRTQELLDHMRQAIVVFGAGGVVEGAGSRQAADVFGLTELGGRKVQDLLFPEARASNVEARAFVEWLALAFDADESIWSEVSALAPPEVSLTLAGEPRTLAVEFRLIVREGGARRVMMLATDITDQRRLEREMNARHVDDARRAAAMGRLVAGGGYVFVRFTEAARERLDRCEERLRSFDDPNVAIEDIFRDIHTIKGEARSFDLGEMSDELDVLEESLSRMRSQLRSGAVIVRSVRDDALRRIIRARELLQTGIDRFVAASPIGAAALEQVTVRRSDLEDLVATVGDRSDPVGVAVSRLVARPFGESTSGLDETIARWAVREGKEISIDISGREVPIPNQLARDLSGMLAHLVRNAIAHGIEAPGDRAALGKTERGKISIRCDLVDGAPCITVEDDGAGIDEASLRDRARDMGIDPTSFALIDLLGLSGLSTRASESALAGRGVGVGAVAAQAAALGYLLEVRSRLREGTTFVLRACSR